MNARKIISAVLALAVCSTALGANVPRLFPDGIRAGTAGAGVNQSIFVPYSSTVTDGLSVGDGTNRTITLGVGSTESRLRFTATQPFRFYSGPTEVMSLGVSGNAAFPAGTGVDFSANSNAAGMTSEVLTRYEEGTWTPVIEGSTGAGTATYATNGRVGYYTRVGRQVTVHGYIDLDNLTGATGNILISGLPYSQVNATSVYAHCAQFDFLGLTTTTTGAFPGGFVTPNFSKISMINVPPGGSTSSQSVSTDTDFTIWFTCTYTAQ